MHSNHASLVRVLTAQWVESARSTGASLREAVSRRVLANVGAGVTVALVALPLNVALAIACGLPAAVGLVTGAIAGILGALLGGSRLQITGPEVALAPITFEIVARFGFEGLLAATFLAGLFQIVFGLLRLGRLVHVVPLPVIGGFLAAVGIMVFDSQLPVLLGVSHEARLVTELEPDVLLGVNGSAVAIGVVVILVLVGLPRVDKRAPAALIALAVAIAIVATGSLTVPMVEPFEWSWPRPAVPDFAGLDLWLLAPEALALALIASIDSLLCAVSVDSRLGGPRTRTDQELVAQGLANLGSACVGGMPVAAAIVRSMAAVEAGASTRLAPVVQSLVLALAVVAFGEFVGHVPLAALAAVLLVVGFRLIDWRMVVNLWKVARFEVVVFASTAAGILLTDFVSGVVIGVVVALADFAYRQGNATHTHSPDASAQGSESLRVGIVRVEGPLFFASQARLEGMLEHLDRATPTILDLGGVRTLDTSGATALARTLERVTRGGAEVWLVAPDPDIRRRLDGAISVMEYVHSSPSIEAARQQIGLRRWLPGEPWSASHSSVRWPRLPDFEDATS